MSGRNLQRACRWAFWLYAPVLFIATHVPGLTIESTGRRPDLVIHATVFGIWAALLTGSAYFGPALSWRNILAVGWLGLAYSAADEALQAMPALRRRAALDDWTANVIGIVAVCAGAWAAGMHRTRRQNRRDGTETADFAPDPSGQRRGRDTEPGRSAGERLPSSS